jgi:hypothetical protein
MTPPRGQEKEVTNYWQDQHRKANPDKFQTWLDSPRANWTKPGQKLYMLNQVRKQYVKAHPRAKWTRDYQQARERSRQRAAATRLQRRQLREARQHLRSRRQREARTRAAIHKGFRP